jgi:hypothetical protein
MDALDLRIMERVARLNQHQKENLIRYIDLAERDEPAQLTMGEWLEEARAFRAELEQKYGKDHYFDSLEVLDEIREERLNDLMGSV